MHPLHIVLCDCIQNEPTSTHFVAGIVKKLAPGWTAGRDSEKAGMGVAFG